METKARDSVEMLRGLFRLKKVVDLAARVAKAKDATPKERVTLVMFMVAEVVDYLLAPPEDGDGEKCLAVAREGIEKVINVLGQELARAEFLLSDEEIEPTLEWARSGCPPRHNWNLAQELLREEGAKQ